MWGMTLLAALAAQPSHAQPASGAAPATQSAAPAEALAPAPDAADAHLPRCAGWLKELATLAPADTGLFIALHDVASWEQRYGEHPLWPLLTQLLPCQERPRLWRRLQFMMNLDQRQFVERYLGKSVALLLPDPFLERTLTMASRVAPADSQALVEALRLLPLGAVGAYQLYTTPDRGARVAISPQWVLLTSAEGERQLRRLVEQPADDPRLATEPLFRQALAEAPGHTPLLVYARTDDSQCQTGWIEAGERQMTVHFLVRSPQVAPWRQAVLRATHNRASVAPACAALSVRLELPPIDLERPHPLDAFLAPQRFYHDILGRMASPIVFFVCPPPALGACPEGPAEARQVPSDLPTLGLSFAWRDAALADDLDVILTNLTSVLGQTARDEQGAPAYTVQAVAHAGGIRRSAACGPVLAARTGWRELDGVALTWGRVGDRYIICTREREFSLCAGPCGNDAQTPVTAAPAAAIHEAAAGPALTDADRKPLVAQVQLQAAPLRAMLQRWIEQEQNEAGAGGPGGTGGTGGQVVQSMEDVDERLGVLRTAERLLRSVRQVDAQVRAVDDHTLRGQVLLRASDPPPTTQPAGPSPSDSSPAPGSAPMP